MPQPFSRKLAVAIIRASPSLEELVGGQLDQLSTLSSLVHLERLKLSSHPCLTNSLLPSQAPEFLPRLLNSD